jgi:ribosomal protein S18 acetylase RimI-like enzyme
MTFKKMMNKGVHQLKKQSFQAKKVGQSMAKAFLHEGNFIYMIPNEKKRQEALSWFFGDFVCRLGLKYGKVYLTADGSGGSIWMDPGNKVKPMGAIQAGMLSMPFHFGWRSFMRSTKLNSAIEKIRHQVIPVPHYYLMAIGVDPSKQGEGLGKALMQPGLSEADTHKKPCYLETFSEKKLRFYQNFGFEVCIESKTLENGPVFWGMKRIPIASL